ncbi:MAG: GntR family transcriptional regulator [Armatimonas sp.]
MSTYRYHEIAASLREQIQCQELVGKLPGERTLMAQFGVQRNTIRQALELLEQEGWLEIRPRSGAYACSASNASRLDGGTILLVNSWNKASNAINHVFLGISAALESSPISVQRFNSQPRPGSRFHVYPSAEYIAANKVVGIALWAQNPTDVGALMKLREAVPLVLIDRRILGFEADCVRSDDMAGGKQLTEHLLQQGHRRIGFVGDEAFAETVQQRWRGYTLALEEAGLTLEPSLMALFEGIQEPNFSEALRILIAGNGDPLTALICSNDTTALLVLKYLQTHKIRVPQDIAVAGYGNLLSDYMDTIGLTTVEQPFEEVGKLAGELLIRRLTQARDWKRERPEIIDLPVRLVARDSTNSIK